MRMLALLCLMSLPASAADFAQLAGHGGPIKGVAVSPDGDTALTASFDYSVGLWPMDPPGAPRWLEGHRAAVNTVLFLPDGRAASGGDDFDIRIWNIETGTSQRLEGHKGKVMALDVSPDGRRLASAAWDGWVGLWDLETGERLRMMTGHASSVNDVAFAEDGRTIYSASADGTIRRWDVETGQETLRVLSHGFGINQLVLNEEKGWLAYGALDGGTRVVSLGSGELLADLTLERRPILAMSQSPDGSEIAVGDGEGYIMVVETEGWHIVRDFRAARRGPVWALDYGADGENVLAGGIDDSAYFWPVHAEELVQMARGERSFLKDPETMENGARQFYRKCSICHTLTPDGARRAGPSLYGVFGRPAGTLEGYSYSPALTGLDLVWTAETIEKLFEIGPDHYTPGSKMPMQRIARPEDRADLIAFLRRETTPKSGEMTE